MTKARGRKVVGQEKKPGSAKECEGMNPHIPKGNPMLRVGVPNCRNPTLAKCGGEAQHLEKVKIWSPLGLPNVQSSTARPKTPRIEVSLERS
jgi:hypothetical protein